MKIDYISPEYTSAKSGIRKKDGIKLGPTLATLWTVACQVPLSMAFSRQEYWSGFAILFSRGSCRPRNRIQVPSTEGRFFTN